MQLVLQDRVGPVRHRAVRNLAPVTKAIFYTLDISVRFLVAEALGTASVAKADRLIDGYWRRIFRSGNARLVAEGRDHFDGRPSIVMSNHTSLIDIPALMGAIPGSMRMVTKEELTKVPIWGPALIKSGFVPVRRGSKAVAVEQLGRAKEVLGKGVHVWIAPEGTRSRTGEVLPFKKGGFHLARSLGAPIVPAWIMGAADIMPPGRLRAAHDGTVMVRFGRPIESSEGAIDDLVTQVRAAMLALRDGITAKPSAHRAPFAAIEATPSP